MKIKQLKILLPWAFFTSLYIIYVKKQYINIFFESQFLHINFLQEILNKNFTLKNFFTSYGEHIFPGYNLIILVNYYLFKLSAGLDFILNILCQSLTALMIILFIDSNKKNTNKKTLTNLILCLLLISTTLNPQTGMALSASVGVFLYVLYVYILVDSLENGSSRYFSSISILFLTTIIFLGGYSVAVYVSLIIFYIILKINKINNKLININLLISVIYLIFYILLVASYGSLTANAPIQSDLKYTDLFKFFLVMGGSSLLGKAFYESYNLIFWYYIYGFLIYYISLLIFIKKIKKPFSQIDYFLSLILVYSFTNIIIVSLFRYKNGIDGGMGQWYNVHTHFIAAYVIYYLANNRFLFSKKLINVIFIFFILLGGAVGYYFDWHKAQFIPQWKAQFLNQAPILLLSENNSSNKFTNSFQSMLWDYDGAKKGVDFLYKNHLWIFNTQSPLIFPINRSHGLKDDIYIACPLGTKRLRFSVYQMGLNTNLLPIKIKESGHITIASAGIYEIDFKNLKPIAHLGCNKNDMVHNQMNCNNLHIKNISCDGAFQSSNFSNIPIKILAWGPDKFERNSNPPNIQPDGSIGFWVKTSNSSEYLNELSVEINGVELSKIYVEGGLVTFGVPPKFFSKPGVYNFYFRSNEEKKFKIGELIID